MDEAALKERDVLVEAEGAAGGLVFGHGDTKGRGMSGPPTLGGRVPSSLVSVVVQDQEMRREEASLPEDDPNLEKGHTYRTLVLIGRGEVCASSLPPKGAALFNGLDSSEMSADRWVQSKKASVSR